jgi:hypothetical protein
LLWFVVYMRNTFYHSIFPLENPYPSTARIAARFWSAVAARPP